MTTHGPRAGMSGRAAKWNRTVVGWANPDPGRKSNTSGAGVGCGGYRQTTRTRVPGGSDRASRGSRSASTDSGSGSGGGGPQSNPTAATGNTNRSSRTMPDCIDGQKEVWVRECHDGAWGEPYWTAQSQLCPQGPLDIQAAPADPVKIALAMAEAFGRGFAQGMRGGCGGK